MDATSQCPQGACRALRGRIGGAWRPRRVSLPDRCAHAQDAVLPLPMTVVGQRGEPARERPGAGAEPATTCRTRLWIGAGIGPRVDRE